MIPLEKTPENLDILEEEQDDFYSDDDLFKISSWGADLSFRELIARYDEDELVKPELQRHYVWDKTEASRFIDSILLGLPVPSIFLAKTKDEKLLIIDGYQRLMTVRDFVKGIFSKDGKVFKLSRSQKIHERWRGKAFTELEEDERRRIRNTTIHAIIFMQRHPINGDTSLYQVFERINSSGRTLLPQEIRNCVYQGPINTLLFELNSNPKWRTLFGKNEVDERMRDMEYILRFFALSDEALLYDDKFPLSISLKKYLNQFMDNNNDISKIDAFRDRFNKCIEFAYNKLSDSAFHNISSTGEARLIDKFSPTVFDSLLISIDIALKNGFVADSDEDFVNRKMKLLRNPEFQEKLSKETMRVLNIRYRIFNMYKALFGDIKNE
ncbi:hypothetical protein CSA37_00265 [Candidatus Fermentibacteria bacterium]|nr:MAG: hypothetical protein CSA37_00265 [Candidatus Fermentibacteria bacterium]